jgi:hypothetical protein
MSASKDFGLGRGPLKRETPMRSTLRLLAATGLIFASAGAALAAPMSSSTSSMGAAATASGDTASTPRTSDQAPSSSANSAATVGSNASATTGGFQVGEPVKDNTGATIGQIAALTPGAGGATMAVIKMGSDSFQVATDRLGSSNGAATINLTQGQIASMVHAKGAASMSSGTATGESGAGGGSAPK